MLRIYDEGGIDRRQFLTVGSLCTGGLGLGRLGLGSLALPLLSQVRAASSDSSAVTGKSVIFLFQQGGPSQFETFDPKVDAPTNVRTVTGTIPTTVPGLHFGDTLQKLSKQAHKLTVVRSYESRNAGHNIRPIVGPFSLEANIGTHYSAVVGPTRSDTGMPTNAVIYPASVSSEVPRPEARGNLGSTGPYGKEMTPFVPGAGGQLQEDMQLRLSPDRIEDRRQLLRQLDRLRREVDSSDRLAGVEKMRRQAYEVLLGGGVSRAFDLTLEDRRTLELYDTSKYARKGQWDKVNRGRRGYYTAQAKTIGHLLLLARRLCEAGCGFVTIHAGYAGVWDMHADGNNLNMLDGMKAVGSPFDHAVSAFIEDLEARGQQDKILLVATGEMGRQPQINKRGGRDHWGRLAPLMLYGGGLSGGQVIGKSDSQGYAPSTETYNPSNLISTILHTVFDIGKLRLETGVPREVLQLAEAKPIPVERV